jgi:Na+-driven multidrug efflux pump
MSSIRHTQTAERPQLGLVFETAAVFILPALFGVDGIWFAIIFAEVLSLILSVVMLKKHKERYHYA